MGVTRSEFEAVFPEIEAILTAHCKQYNIPDQALTWFQKSLPYNTLGGKYNRGLSVPDTAALLLGHQLSPEEHKLTCILGWLTELLQAFFLVSDDIMDASITRRGQPCWYKAPGVGMVAINDAFMLESGIYIILKTLFRSHPRYVDFVELFHEVTFKTEVGQLCDLLTAPEDDVDLSKFSMDKFRFIVIYKTAYYSFYLPVALALLFIDTTPSSTGVASPENLKQCEDILIPLGEYFQAQDDYLDAYGAPEVIGKIGTDIMDNKCSWLVNTALAKADASQRQILEENYGVKDSAKEKKVKELYKEMNLQGVYSEYEEEKVKYIRSLIDKVDESHGLQKSVFETFLGRIYKRSK